MTVNISGRDLRCMVLECVRLLTENYYFYDEMEDFPISDLMQEFLSNKEHGIATKHWDVIPAQQYLNLLIRFTDNPATARIPGDIVHGWFRDIIIRNTISIEYITELAGHTRYFPSEDLEYVFDKEGDYDYWSEYLDGIGFYDWCKLPDGSDAWSDYGLEPIARIVSQYDPSMEPEEVLVLINRVLDVYHQRGDLASAFIEGGTGTLTRISSWKPHYYGPI